MNRYLRTLRSSPFTQGMGVLLVTLVCAAALIGCQGDTTNNTYQSAPTSLRITVNPASADVTVTSAVASFVTQTFTGNKVLTGLAAGQYTAKAIAPGFASATGSVNVVAGVTSDIQLILQPTPIIVNAPRTVYRDENGNLVPIDTTAMQAGQFVFYAWLQDNTSGGIVPSLIMTSATVSGDPGRALVSEQTETAPSFTQNLAGAYVGFMDASGVVRPVIGADVRWEIDQQYSGRVNSMQFGTSDDNRVALNYGVFDDQADTRTNNSHLTAERFPLIATEYPLFNMTGIGTPFADGFTWVTLFSPDTKAAGRIVAVATVNGEEIGKQILYKQFAPQPKLDITKTVDQNIVNLGAGPGTVTWTVTIHNTGTGEATSVNLRDYLASGDGANYTLGALPAGCSATADPDIFNCTFPTIAAPGAPAPPQTAQRLGNAWNFAVLANTSISNVGPSVVTGEVGISAGTSITGFPPGIILSGTKHISDAAAAAAQISVTAAKAALDGMACTTGPVGVTDIGNTTVSPGVHCYSSSLALTGPVTLDAGGNPNAEFIFRIGSTLNTAAGSAVILKNGANPCNIYWQVGSSATLQAASSFVGNILAYQDITAITGASISGRALASVGQVTLGTNAVTAPLSCVAAPAETQTLTFTSTVTATGTYCNAAAITMYTGATSTVGLSDQVCFTAVAPDLAIVKDFVADDNVTSLGKEKTVAANVPAKLRVQVVNNGGGTATGVQVTDAFNAALSTGILANYKVVSSASTTNALGGFDANIGDLVSGASATTMFFAVAASVDGTYCDTATITAGGTGQNDTACLIVATPNLTIAKTDAPTTVLPGATYTSTIVVTNNGNAPAANVVVSDLLGINAAANVQVIYVSSNQSGAAGTLANNVVTANSVVSLAVNETLTFTVVSRIPLGAPSGNYCDVATVTSSNVVTKQTPTVCVFVPSFSALQTQLTDFGDPVLVGGDVTYFSTLYVESLSNEGVDTNVLTYLFGHVATDLVTPGVFDVTSTKVYVDTAPIKDPITGVVVSDTTSPTAVLQTLGTDYTVTTVLGKQVITMTPATVLQPNTAIYVVNVVRIPAGTAAGMKTTSYIWDSDGPTTHYKASSSEPTTVLP